MKPSETSTENAMITPGGMRWIDARSIQENDVVLRDGKLTRVVRLEWPYAVIRIFDAARAEFGDRRITRLEGRFFIPSRRFLREAGVYESRLLAFEDPDSFVIDLASVVETRDGESRITTMAEPDDESSPGGASPGSNASGDSEAGTADDDDVDVVVEESDVPLHRLFESEIPNVGEWRREPTTAELRAGDELALEWFAPEPTLHRRVSRGPVSLERPRPSF